MDFKDFEGTDFRANNTKLGLEFAKEMEDACNNLLDQFAKIGEAYTKKGLHDRLAKGLTALIIKRFYESFSRVFSEDLVLLERFEKELGSMLGKVKDDDFNQS